MKISLTSFQWVKFEQAYEKRPCLPLPAGRRGQAGIGGVPRLKHLFIDIDFGFGTELLEPILKRFLLLLVKEPFLQIILHG